MADSPQHRPADARSPGSPAEPQVRVGCTGVGPRRDVYFRRFSLLEYQQSFFQPPSRRSLRRLAAQAPAGFVFAVKAWQLVTHEPSSAGYHRLAQPPAAPPDSLGHLADTEAVYGAWTATLEVATALDAPLIVLETPAAFTPSAAHRSRLMRFCEQVPRATREIVWDPKGLWAEAEILALCRDLDLTPCWDPFARESFPATTRAYLKLQGLGADRPFADSELQWLLDGARQYPICNIVFNNIDMMRDATRFTGLMRSTPAP